MQQVVNQLHAWEKYVVKDSLVYKFETDVIYLNPRGMAWRIIREAHKNTLQCTK